MFQLVSVKVLTCRKEAKNKKRKKFSLHRKSLSASENEVFHLNIGFPLISLTVSTCRKRDEIRENGFLRIENASPPYGLEDSFKNTFPLDGK